MELQEVMVKFGSSESIRGIAVVTGKISLSLLQTPCETWPSIFKPGSLFHVK